MGVELDHFWTTGLVAVFIGITALVMLIRMDLAPIGSGQSTLNGGGRLFLGAALGIGIIAFSIKLLVVYLLSSYPEQTIAPLLLHSAQARTTPKPNFETIAAEKSLSSAQSWTALPTMAPAPLNNPTTPKKVALGKRLFNDPQLSKDRTVSCASCHDLEKYGGADGRDVAVGVDGIKGGRNTPTVFNAAFQSRLFWDGRASSLEKQAIGPLLNPIEMAMPSSQAVVDRVKENPAYHKAFKEAFGASVSITIDNIARAIAAYERTLITNDTPYDRFINGDDKALTPSQKKGMYLFQELGCKACHAGANFSGASLIGLRRPFAHLRTDRLDIVAQKNLSHDKGRTSPNSQYGLWRIPSLRNVALTAPYFHNGSVKTLSEAVEIMARSQLNAIVGIPPEETDPEALSWSDQKQKFHLTKRKHVSHEDIEHLVAFLNALSSDRLKTHQNN